MRRVAVIGAGIAGMSAAHALSRSDSIRVTLFEAQRRYGGHAHTVEVQLEGVRHGVDTGFLVFNHATYPRLTRLFDALGVETAASEMSFSVQHAGLGLEWAGTSLGAVFAQRRNLASPRFLRMLADIVRFNRLCTGMAERGSEAALDEPIDDFLNRHRFGDAFREGYFLPMIGCIWSCPTDRMLRFPVATMIRFCHNHGLIRLGQRPQWYTVRGGSQRYVERLLPTIHEHRSDCPVLGVRRLPPGGGQAGVELLTAHGRERFDEVVLACHSDESLALLDDATADERSVLGAIRWQRNRAVLHTDAALLPRQRRAWAAWNYERAADTSREQAAVCLHYLINRLQPLPWTTPVLVSLNPAREPAPGRVIGSWDYAHPVFDAGAIAAQRRLPLIQGQSHLWFAGAWTGYGFHEDGLASGLAVADELLARVTAGRVMEAA